MLTRTSSYTSTSTGAGRTPSTETITGTGALDAGAGWADLTSTGAPVAEDRVLDFGR